MCSAAFSPIPEHTADIVAVGSEVKHSPDPLQTPSFEAPGTY